MKAMLGLLLLTAATPALAEGFNLTQLIQADFELKEALPGGPGRGDILYLQGTLPGGTYEVIMRCIARPDPEEGEPNCQQVY